MSRAYRVPERTRQIAQCLTDLFGAVTELGEHGAVVEQIIAGPQGTGIILQDDRSGDLFGAVVGEGRDPQKRYTRHRAEVRGIPVHWRQST